MHKPPTEYVWGVRRIIGQIILKYPFVAAFSISIQNLMAMDRTTMFSFFIRKRLHYSSCRQDEIIVIVVGRWRIQFCLQKEFSSRHGLMIFYPSVVHLGLAQVLYAPCPSVVLPVCLLPKWRSPLLLPESGRRGAAGRCQVLAPIREDRGAQHVPVCGVELPIREGRRLEEAVDGRRARRQAAQNR